MPTKPASPRSYLFTMRLWVEEIGPEQHEVRMQVKHVLSGETRYFREWAQVAAYLTSKLDPPSTAQSVSQP